MFVKYTFGMFFLSIIWILCSVTGFSQEYSFDVDGNAIGIITQDNAKIGTAFITSLKSDIVITCAHLFKDGFTGDVRYNGINYSSQVKLVYISYEKDIALLQIDGNAKIEPLQISTEFDLIVGEQLVLSGFDFSFSQLENQLSIVMSPVVISRYHYFNNFNRIDIHFFGMAEPGYSGGPIFTTKGEVYAMLWGGDEKVRDEVSGKILNKGVVLHELEQIINSLEVDDGND